MSLHDELFSGKRVTCKMDEGKKEKKENRNDLRAGGVYSQSILPVQQLYLY